MKNHHLFIMLLILLLFAAGITGLYRGKEAAKQTETVAPPPTEQTQSVPESAQQELPPPPPVEQTQPVPPPAPAPPAVRPHSPEHATALRVTQALELPAPQRATVLNELVQQGVISQETANRLNDWRSKKGDVPLQVQEVGNVLDEQARTKETRYRISTTGDGGEHIVLSISAPTEGKASAVQQAKEVPADKTHVTSESDSLSVAEGFVEALKRGDMETARRLTAGGDVTDATLAGLCMVFEEGDFVLRNRLPLRNMFSNGANAGFLVYLSPRNGSEKSRNVGIEMTHDAQRGWVIKAVALDDMLNRYEESAHAEGGVYFPIVKNPQGGDSVVLYFAFDDATLSPRSLKQLKIVANLLASREGNINISGHTDDVGSSSYNQDLSERRAAAVRDALVAQGVAPERITTRGLGKRQPLRSYRTGDSRQTISTIRGENRRAEVYLDF